MENPGRTLRQRRLSNAAREWSATAGLTGRALAEETRLSPATISRIMNGEGRILAKNIKTILEACGAPASEVRRFVALAEEPEDSSWWMTFSDTMPDWFTAFVELESAAESINTYTSEIIDGLCQTRDYAEAVAKARPMPGRTDADIARSIDLREARQAQLDRLRLHLVMNELAVIRPAASDDPMMREQILHLLELMERPNITIQILRFSAGLHAAVRGPFTLMRFPEGYDDMDCVYLETENGGIWQERSSDIESYSAVFASVCDLAISPEESRALLASLV